MSILPVHHAASERSSHTIPSLQPEPQNVEARPLAKFPNYDCRDLSIFEKRRCILIISAARGAGAEMIRSIYVLHESNYRLRTQAPTCQTVKAGRRQLGASPSRLVGSETEQIVNHKSLGPSSHCVFVACHWPRARRTIAYVRLLIERVACCRVCTDGDGPYHGRCKFPFRLADCSIASASPTFAQSPDGGSNGSPVWASELIKPPCGLQGSPLPYPRATTYCLRLE